MKTRVVLLAILLGTPAWAQDGEGHWAKRFWKASLGAIAAGTATDIQSSLGKSESNGLLANRQGVFSAQGIGLKLAIAGASLGTQQYLLHRHPSALGYRTGALINFAVAGTLGGVTLHNYSNRAVQ